MGFFKNLKKIFTSKRKMDTTNVLVCGGEKSRTENSEYSYSSKGEAIDPPAGEAGKSE
jgi:hypothetical protein